MLKQMVRLKDNAENDMFLKKYNTLHKIKEKHQVDYRYMGQVGLCISYKNDS